MGRNKKLLATFMETAKAGETMLVVKKDVPNNNVTATANTYKRIVRVETIYSTNKKTNLVEELLKITIKQQCMIPYNKRLLKVNAIQIVIALAAIIACCALVALAIYIETINHPYKLY